MRLAEARQDKGCLQRGGSSLSYFFGGNTNGTGMKWRGLTRLGEHRQGLFTAVSIYWVFIGGNTNWLVPARHGKPRRGKARAVISGKHLLGAFRWQHQLAWL